MRRHMTIVIAALVLVYAGGARADTVRGTVVRVIDGDTVVVRVAGGRSGLKSGGTVRVRLAGIDAPEIKQAYGPEAKRSLAQLVEGRIVQIQYSGRDRWGRIIGTLVQDNRDICRELVLRGDAWWFRRYSRSVSLAAAEESARADGRGLWSNANAAPPWDFRGGAKSAR